jgi:hypothetical protein
VQPVRPIAMPSPMENYMAMLKIKPQEQPGG